jgi:hypothetical protein
MRARRRCAIWGIARWVSKLQADFLPRRGAHHRIREAEANMTYISASDSTDSALRVNHILRPSELRFSGMRLGLRIIFEKQISQSHLQKK